MNYDQPRRLNAQEREAVHKAFMRSVQEIPGRVEILEGPPTDGPAEKLRQRVVAHITERLAKATHKKDKNIFLSDEAWALVLAALRRTGEPTNVGGEEDTTG